MAVSGSQKTRIGIGPVVGIKVTIIAKFPSSGFTTMFFGRGLNRSIQRGSKR